MMKEIEKIVLERGMCYGTCPVYKITIYEDGRVEWDGKHYVQEAGMREWSISSENFNEIVKSIEKSKLVNMKDNYTEAYTTCMPSTVLVVHFKDKTKKKIDHDHGDSTAPKKLTWLENRIDKLSGTKKYIGKID